MSSIEIPVRLEFTENVQANALEYIFTVIFFKTSPGAEMNELAKKSMNLVLIARKAELLNKIAHEIQTHYGVQVEVIIADFGLGKSIFKNIEESLEGKDIGILINNVGVAFEKIRYFHEASEEKIWNMINVNISAMNLMTKMILQSVKVLNRI